MGPKAAWLQGLDPEVPHLMLTAEVGSGSIEDAASNLSLEPQILAVCSATNASEAIRREALDLNLHAKLVSAARDFELMYEAELSQETAGRLFLPRALFHACARAFVTPPPNCATLVTPAALLAAGADARWLDIPAPPTGQATLAHVRSIYEHAWS